jgi:ergothioneine biosynthesis protein EgtB
MRFEVAQLFRYIREDSLAMCEDLEAAEYRVQPYPDVSPPWWNLGHTSWLFVEAVLRPFGGRLTGEDEELRFLLNSYYESQGPRLERHRRGSMTRPTTDEVYAYRKSVDERVLDLMQTVEASRLENLAQTVMLACQHEEQHQELFFTEIKAILFENVPSQRRKFFEWNEPESKALSLEFLPVSSGLVTIGAETGWSWDNEQPAHPYYLQPYQMANRLVTNGEYLAFMEEGGYCNPLLWLTAGWRKVQEENWAAPLYWEKRDSTWWEWTLHGARSLEFDAPVCHVSFWEADAYARWAGARLPTEQEWECLVKERYGDDWFGRVWQWTTSEFGPYPGFKPFEGFLGEYNGKFMTSGQRVLRGSSCATSSNHSRPTYRNFWPPETRFQFTGIRLAKDG